MGGPWGAAAGVVPRLFCFFFFFSFFCGGGSCGCCFPLFPAGTCRRLRGGGGVLWVWVLVVLCCGPTVAAVGGLAAYSGRGPLGCPPPPFFFAVCGSVSLPAVLVVSTAPWLVVCLFPGRGLCRPLRDGLSSDSSVAPWPLWSAFSGWGLSPCWAGWSPSVLAVGPVGVARGLAWLGGCPPWWNGCVVSGFCGCLSCLPLRPLVGGFVLVGRRGLPLFLVAAVSCWYVGGVSPPPCCFFLGGGLPLPPSALPGPVHALVGERRDLLARRSRCGVSLCCGWLRAVPRLQALCALFTRMG